MKSRALGIFLATLMVACGPPAGTLFRATLVAPDGTYPMPVTLGDTSGLVIAMDAGVQDATASNDPSVTTDAANPNVLIVSWMGGACEDETVMGFWPDDEGYGMYIATRGGPGIGGGCPAIAIPRVIRLTLSSPIPAEAVRFTNSG